MSANTDGRKQSFYIPSDVLEEIKAEASRQERSLSWLVQKAWKIARDQIKNMPGGPAGG